MGDRTAIAWTDATWNPIIGCTRVSEGCRHCYAERQAIRQGSGRYAGLVQSTSAGPRWTGEVRLVEEALSLPLRWQRSRRIFVNSMGDVFHERVPDAWIDRVFAVMALAPQHTYQILTKRPERMRDYMTALCAGERLVCDAATEIHGGLVGGLMVGKANRALPLSPNRKEAPPYDPWPFVWLGVSVEDQASADTRVPLLLQTPAAVRFLSCEPLLGPIDLTGIDAEHHGAEFYCIDALTGRNRDMGRPCRDVPAIDWLIVGGESGPDARPCDLAWIRALLAQAKTAGCSAFVKQLGAHTVNSSNVFGPWPVAPAMRFRWNDRAGADPAEWPADLRVQEWPR